MDHWGIDILVTGSQKALMLPPGLALPVAQCQGVETRRSCHTAAILLRFGRERKEQQKHTTAYTPAISLINGLHEVLRLLRAEGLEHVFARHALPR